MTSLVCMSVVTGNSFALSGGAGSAADAVACMPASVLLGLIAIGGGAGIGGLAIAVEGGFSVGGLSGLTLSAEMTRVCKGPVWGDSSCKRQKWVLDMSRNRCKAATQRPNASKCWRRGSVVIGAVAVI